MILAIETATEVCSVAFQEKDRTIYEKRIVGKGVHATHLFFFIHELMATHQFKITDLKSVLVSNGPGSYTGLRIGASAVKGLLFGTQVSVFAANTLAGFAQSQIETGKPKKYRIHSIIDARRTHLYAQEFTVMKNLVPVTQPEFIEIEKFEATLRSGDVIVGTGLERIKKPDGADISTFGTDCISAKHLITLFNEQPDSGFFKKMTLEALNPNYITSNQVNNTVV